MTLVTVAAPISYFVLLGILMWQAGDGGSLAPLHSCSILLCDMRTRSKYVAPLLLRCQDADSMSISHLMPTMGDPHNKEEKMEAVLLSGKKERLLERNKTLSTLLQKLPNATEFITINNCLIFR